ncbi:uncharacterized protein LOC142319526 [Lycorma delicatula]|uniref:uncharacterized protein LOC142319526 n=1 Tax=Lycorma delicatula TaxID=130591 RepID=UPI003F511297
MSDKMKVAIRLRPLNDKEKAENLLLHWKTDGNNIFQVDPTTGRPKSDAFTFDHVFNESESNTVVFDKVVKPIVDASMQGFNGTVFAYGQTSSGKTFTMSGTHKHLGIIPLAINYIFYSIENTPGREFLLRVSYMEIYNEKVNDLLEMKKKNLKLHEDSNGQVVVDVEERVCRSSQEVMEEKYKGDKNRRIGETNMNERSSRSHTIFRIILESRTTDDEDGAVKVSHVNLVDLAGSERAGQSGATGDRFKEGCHINSSLSTLGIVINQLSEGQEGQFINFRDSKLTRLLQSSLGGNAMTAVICPITPAAEDQSQNTINFALRAKKIKNTPMLNEVLSDAALIKRYRRQIAKLSQELEDIKQKNTSLDVQEMEYKLKEKEEVNERLNIRINRLKEALLVSSSSPMNENKSKMKSRSRRRMTWGGQCDRRSLFPSSSPTLCTIAEDSSIPSTPQANSTRLDEIICPFEKFELELMKEKQSWAAYEDADEFFDDTQENVTLANNVTKYSDATMQIESGYDVTLTDQSQTIPSKEPETPPSVLRERISSISHTLTNVIKDYDELREYTTLEKQLLGNECSEHAKQLDEMSQHNSTLRAALENKTSAYNEVVKLYNELNASYNLEVEKNKLIKDVNYYEEEIKELKEQNTFLHNELKLKSESFEELQKQFDVLNKNIMVLSEEKLKLEEECKKLQRKYENIEKKNFDLEVTLDLKKKKFLERESELEKELLSALETLEKWNKSLTGCGNEELPALSIRTLTDQSQTITSKEPETPPSVLRERISSISHTLTNVIKDYDELREYTTLEKQLLGNESALETLEKWNKSLTLCGNEELPALSRLADDKVKEKICADTPVTNSEITVTDLTDSLSPQITSNLSSETEIRFVSCNTSLVDQSVTNTLSMDPLRSFCLSESMLPINITCTPETFDKIEETQSITKEYDEIANLKNEYDGLKVQFENIKIKYDNSVFNHKKEVDELKTCIESCNNLVTNLYKIVDINEENNSNHEKLIESITKFKHFEQDLNKFKIDKNEFLMKLEEYEYYDELLKKLKYILNLNDNEIKINEVEGMINSFKSKIFDLEKLTESDKEIIKCYNEEIKKLKNDLNEKEKYSEILQDCCLIFNECLDVNVTKLEIKAFILQFIQKSSDLKIQLSDFEQLQKEKDCLNEIELNSRLEKSLQNEKIIDNICEILKQEMKQDIEKFEITNVIDNLIQKHKHREIEINELAKALEDNKSSEMLLNDLCVMLQEKVGITDKSNIKDVLISLTDLKLEFDNIKLKLTAYKEYEVVINNLCKLLNEKLQKEISQDDLLDNVKTLFVSIGDLNRELSESHSLCYEIQKEYMSKVEEMKNELDNADDLLKRLCSALNDRLEADVDKNNLSDTVLSLVQYKEEYNRMSVSLEEKKEFSEIINNLCTVLQDDMTEGVPKDKIEDFVVTLKRNNTDLKKQLQDRQKITTETESEISTIKAELEANKMYETIINDVCCVLNEAEDEAQQQISIDKVKNSVISLKESNSELRQKLDYFQNINIETENQYKFEIDMLKSELHTGKVYESVMNDLLCVLQDESESDAPELDVKNAVVSLKENNTELKKTLENLQATYDLKESQHKTEIELLKDDLELFKVYEGIVCEVCCILKEKSTDLITKDEVAASVKSLKYKIEELKQALEEAQCKNKEMLAEIDLLKSQVVVNDECKEIIDNLCVILQENSDLIVTNNSVTDIVESLKKSVVELRSQLSVAEDVCIKNEESRKSLEKIVNDVCSILQVEDKNTIENMKCVIINLKESNEEMKKTIEVVQNKSNEVERNYQHEVDLLKAELETGKIYEAVMNDLLCVLQESKEHELARNDVKIAVIGLKQSNSELKHLLEQVQKSSIEKETQYINEIEKLKADLETGKVYEGIVNELCSILPNESEQIINRDELVLSVKSFRENFKTLMTQYQETQLKINETVAEIKSLREENQNRKEYEMLVEDICILLQENSDRVIMGHDIKEVINTLKDNVINLQTRSTNLETDYSEKERNYIKEINNLKADLDRMKAGERILDRLSSLLLDDNEQVISKNDIENIAISMKKKLKELSNLLDDTKGITAEKEKEIDLLQLKLKEVGSYEIIVEELCHELQGGGNETLPKNEVKNFVINLKQRVNELESKLEISNQTIHENEVKYKTDIEEIKAKLVESEEYEMIINDIYNVLQSESGKSEKNELKNVVAKLIDDNSSLRNNVLKVENICNEKEIQFIAEIDSLKSELEKFKEYEFFIRQMCFELQGNYGFANLENNMKNVTDTLRSFINELKRTVEEAQNTNNEMHQQYKFEIDLLNTKCNDLNTYKVLVDELCNILKFDAKNACFNSLKDIVITLKKNEEDLKVQVDTLQNIYTEFKKKYETDIKLLEDRFNHLKEYKNVISELCSILHENDNHSPSECPIKDSVRSLVEENGFMINELNEVNNRKKEEIDALKEKLESYIECVDICYNLCSLLDDGNDKKISKHEIREVVLNLKKENVELNEQLEIIKNSYTDINSYSKGEIERLENKLKQSAEYEEIVNRISNKIFTVNNSEITKENVTEFVNQLCIEVKSLQKQSRDEKLENDKAVEFYKSEIYKLEKNIEACGKYQDLVFDICKLFTDEHEKITRDEIYDHLIKLKNNFDITTNQLLVLKKEHNDLKSKYELELQELRTDLESQLKYKHIVDEIINLDINGAVCVNTVVDSVKCLQFHKMDLEKEVDELKLINGKISIEKDEYNQIFDLLKESLKLDSNMKKCRIVDAVLDLKKNISDLQNQLVQNSEIRSQIKQLTEENSDLNKRLKDYNECNDFLKHLSTVITETENPIISKSEIISTVVNLKENNCQLSEQLIDLEKRNEDIIAKLNIASEDLKAKLQVCREKELILCDLHNLLNGDSTNYDENKEVLESAKILKAENSNLTEKVKRLFAENKNIMKLESENFDLKTKLELYMLNEEIILQLIKDVSIDCQGSENNLTPQLVENLKMYCTDLQKKNIEKNRHDSLFSCLKGEIDKIKEQVKDSDTIGNEEKLIEVGEIVKTGSDIKAEYLEDSVENLKKINGQIQMWQVKDKDIKNKLINEIRNLKPSFDFKICNKHSSVQLLNDFISCVMEKETEIVTHLHNNFKNEILNLQEKITQLKEEKDRLKELNKELQDNVVENINHELKSKSEEISALVIKCESLQDEVKKKSDHVSTIKQKLLEAESDATSLRLEINELQVKAKKEEQVVALNSLTEELKKQIESKEKCISVLKEDLKEKMSKINQMKDLVESKDSEGKKLSEQLNDLQLQVLEKTNEISELNKYKEIYMNEISEMKIKLDEKSVECFDLKCSFNKLKEDYASVRQSLESSSKGSALLQSKLDEVTADLELTKTSLGNLMESMKAEKLHNEKERAFLLVAIEEKSKICEKLEIEFSVLKKEREDIDLSKKRIHCLEKEIEAKDKELKEEKEEKNLKIKECTEAQELLKEKENLCKELETNILKLGQEISKQRDIITNLKIELRSKEQEFITLGIQTKEKLKSIESIETDLRVEKQHSKKLRIKNESLMRKLEMLDQKENLPSSKTLSPNNSQQSVTTSSIYAEKLKTFEKQLFSIFDDHPKSMESAIQIIKTTFEKVKDLETQLTDAELDKNELDKECEDLNGHIEQLNKEIEEYLEKQEKFMNDNDSLKTELENQKKINENFNKCSEKLHKDISSLRTENERLKQNIKEMRNDKISAAQHCEKKQLDISNKDIGTPEFRSLKNKWEQISKSTPIKECKCDDLLKNVQELKVDLANKNSKIAMLEIQIQGENFPYKKKAMLLEESLNESKTKIMTLKQEVRRLQSCLHEVTTFHEFEAGGKQAARKTVSDVAVQASSSFESEQDEESCSSGIVQRQSVNLLKDRISKLERESVLLKRLCRDRNKKIDQLEQELKKAGFSGQDK